MRPLLVLAVVAVSTFVLTSSAPSAPWPATYDIDHVTDGDTVVLRNGQRVRLVQIDTPEVFFGKECYGPQASATTQATAARRHTGEARRRASIPRRPLSCAFGVGARRANRTERQETVPHIRERRSNLPWR